MSFAEEGYLLVRGLLSTKCVDDIREFLHSSVLTCTKTLREKLNCQTNHEIVRYCNEFISGDFRTDILDQQTKQMLAGHFDLATRLSEKLTQIYLEEDVVSLVSELLGATDLAVHMPPVARFVLPNNLAAAVPAHRDASYNQQFGDFVTMWTPFVDIDELCQGVWIYEGSNRQAYKADSDSGVFWKAPLIGLERCRRMTHQMSPGDALFFDPKIVHESGRNSSGNTRISVDNRFFRKRDGSLKSYLDVTNGERVVVQS